MSKICIVVPVYKVEPYLSRCIESVLTQTFNDFELILVDDGSPDDCGVLCDQYAEKDNRIHVIHQKNQGLSAARNAGIDWAFAYSDSEWITFIDSDDWIYNDYLNVLLNGANYTNADVVITNFSVTQGEEPQIDTNSLSAKTVDIKRFYIDNNVIATVSWGKLYRKCCFESIRYPVGKVHEDEFVTYRVLFISKKIAFVDQPMYYYYQNPSGIMHAEWNPRRLDAIQAFEQQIVYFKDYPEIKRRQIKRYETCLYNYLCELEKTDQYADYKRMIHSRLKLLLIKYYREVNWKEVPHIAEKGFPHFMKYYWVILAQIKKIHIV